MAKANKKPPSKSKTLKATFTPGFLADMDSRVAFVKAMKTNYREITDDLGGEDSLSHVKRVLAQKFVWLSAILTTIEADMSNGKIDKATAMGSWVQSLNALSGLASKLGLERKTGSTPWVRSLK
ncbi:MAG: hypothetical protein GX621_08695 [Pirellulaceae bacterium]|nr:hypothetical protein [Pirellulaceae bacterium]